MKPKDWIKDGNEWPYELTPGDNFTPPDWAHATARGIIAELCDRQGIKHELRGVDDMDTRKEIIASLAAIIREGAKMQNSKMTNAESEAPSEKQS